MIELKNVSKRYGRKRVMDDISFTVSEGEITCLIGLNGAGKTTLLKAIMNLTPFQGMITVDGMKVTSKTYQDMVFVPDVLPMPRNMSIQECLDFMNHFYKKWDEKSANELLQFFQLKKEERLRGLSKGYLMRVNLLLGIASGCKYLLMDEPLSGIDILTRERISELLTSEYVDGKAILFTTHEIAEIEKIIDRAVFMKDGRVVSDYYVELLREQEQKSLLDKMREVYV
ncbi:multidrug ABC transporter ATP-binding protein [Bacillaceae bacterium JMAK1]|nr:multidrug ABC transporter ATP-binding protein [Bacillaceae bacterium JMAK1]